MVRSHFPYFNPDKKNPVFFENAGGSQLPLTVIEAVREHMLDHYVQLGAGYELSDRATSTVDAAHDIIKVRTLESFSVCWEPRIAALILGSLEPFIGWDSTMRSQVAFTIQVQTRDSQFDPSLDMSFQHHLTATVSFETKPTKSSRRRSSRIKPRNHQGFEGF